MPAIASMPLMRTHKPDTVTIILRLEGAVTLVAAMSLYRTIGEGWGLFAALFLLPDLSMLGYLANLRIGTTLYNLCHTILVPAILWLIGWGLEQHGLYGPALIWVAHIGFDRFLGYGLKYQSSFWDTHLSRMATGARIDGDVLRSAKPRVSAASQPFR